MTDERKMRELEGEAEKMRELLILIREFSRGFHGEIYAQLQIWAKKHDVQFPPDVKSYAEAVAIAISSAVKS